MIEIDISREQINILYKKLDKDAEASGYHLNPEEESSIAEQIPLRRIGKPEDVADAIVLLASKQANWLTGQLLYVGGGWRMHQ